MAVTYYCNDNGLFCFAYKQSHVLEKEKYQRWVRLRTLTSVPCLRYKHWGHEVITIPVYMMLIDATKTILVDTYISYLEFDTDEL